MFSGKWIGFGTGQANGNGSAGAAAADAKPRTISKADYKQFGLENFGNTCYANSVLQALYFCHPFRELVIQTPDKSNPLLPGNNLTAPPPPAALTNPRARNVRKPSSPEIRTFSDGTTTNGTSSLTGPPIPPSPPTLFSALRALFLYISSNTLDKGTVSPKAFVEKVRKENELFRSSMHQDAHEFLIFLLNKVAEDLEEEERSSRSRTASGEDLTNSVTSSGPSTLGTARSCPPHHTMIQALFEGILTSETRCLTCETVSSRDESFLDLSIDIEQNSSVTACLRQFSASEMLCQKNKFFCDSCCGLQEAEKRMKIKKLPNVLALHLKRFKYQEDVQKYIKLAYRVAFPLELRLFNTVDDAKDPDRLYELFAIVVHIGNGPHHGHYVTIVKSRGAWVVFDDDTVDTVKESDIPKYFGDSNSGCAYVLYYQAADLDPVSLGLKSPTPPPQDSAPASPPRPVPILPPGLTHEGDSDVSELAPATPASPPNTAIPVVQTSPPSVTITIPPPEPTPSVPIPTVATPTTSTTVKSSGRFGLRHSPSKPTVASGPRTSVYSPPEPSIPSVPSASAPSPRVASEASEASTSTASTLPVINGSVKPPKERTSWFGKRRSIRQDKTTKVSEPPPRPATSHESRERHDGSSYTSSSASSRVPTAPDSLTNGRASVPLTNSSTVHSDTSALATVKPLQISPSSSRSPIVTPASPSSSQHHRNFSLHLHSPTHKKSQPVLTSTGPTSESTSSKSTRRPSTAGAEISSPTRRTFSTLEETGPVPPLPSDYRFPPEDRVALQPSLTIVKDDSSPQRIAELTLQQQPATLKRPPRKMSFTGGMLGFGRKDKDKQKDKNHDSLGPLSPSSSHSGSAVSGLSLLNRI